MFLYIFRLQVALFPRFCDNCIACSMGSLKVLTGVNPFGVERPSSPPLDSYLLAESVYFLPPSFLPLKLSANMSGSNMTVFCFSHSHAFHVFIFFPLLLMHWKIFTVDSNFSSGGLLTLSSHHLLITVCVVAGQWTQNCILFFPTTVSCTQPPSNLLLHTLAVLLKLFSWSFSKAHLNLLKSRFCLGQTYSLLPSRFYEHVVL